ncbi:hypothetical protein [Acidipropionibacterium acidipropionici]|uniref:hypothetical protein n=1 Tax=Acidipropionibacterium acidipropionici TaxID=1748 RepID=UPI00110A33C9|nr:hypothetical protein [Acidipropionibacterium acidipropionici]QCV94313.1 hypothetical protein FEZ30_02685 [Acidipropionibacterium acidipropionici]
MSNEDDEGDEDKWFLEGGAAESDDLGADVPLDVKKPPVKSDPVPSLDKQEREQIIELRGKLFENVNGLVSMGLVGGFLLMIVYAIVMRGHLDYRVIVAWYSGVAVQTIGILAVIARNLFPGEARRRR